MLLMLALLQSVRTCSLCFLVFRQAGMQWIALVVSTVTKVLAGVRAAIALAPVRAFLLRIARPDVVQKMVDDNDGQCRRENKGKLAGLVEGVMICSGPPKRQDVVQPIVVQTSRNRFAKSMSMAIRVPSNRTA
jgi:hypothetical protein